MVCSIGVAANNAVKQFLAHTLSIESLDGNPRKATLCPRIPCIPPGIRLLLSLDAREGMVSFGD